MKPRILAVVSAITLAVSANISFAGDAAAGKAKSASCAGCHGADGISPAPNFPNLAGQKEAYLVKQLKDFKSGARKDPMMGGMVAPLTDDDIANLAAYYAGLK